MSLKNSNDTIGCLGLVASKKKQDLELEVLQQYVKTTDDIQQ